MNEANTKVEIGRILCELRGTYAKLLCAQVAFESSEVTDADEGASAAMHLLRYAIADLDAQADDLDRVSVEMAQQTNTLQRAAGSTRRATQRSTTSNLVSPRHARRLPRARH